MMMLGSDNVFRSSIKPVQSAAPARPTAPAGPRPTTRAQNPYESINFASNNLTAEGAFPFPSSNHTGGINVLFCDGGVRFISDTVDGTVWSKLVTPAGSQLPAPFRQMPLGSDEY